MKKLLDEFKTFALKGNVINLAVGVIIGAGFQSIVTSFTDNFISPILGLLVNVNFNALALRVGSVTFGYGAFITALINFLIMAFVIFLLVKFMNKIIGLNKKNEIVTPTTKKCKFCITDIPIDATRCPNCTSELQKSE